MEGIWAGGLGACVGRLGAGSAIAVGEGLVVGLGGARRGVEGPHQPVERCVVDQVVEDVVQRPLHLAQAGPAAGQRALGHISDGSGGGLAEAVVDVGGGAGE